jgi:protein tyrosine/serine phosphatase
MKHLSFTNNELCVNTDVEITNRKTLMPAATSEAIRVAVSTCKHLELVTTCERIAVLFVHYPILLYRLWTRLRAGLSASCSHKLSTKYPS